jgi:hypothetical protein
VRAINHVAWWVCRLGRSRLTGQLGPAGCRIQAEADAVNEVEDEVV